MSCCGGNCGCGSGCKCGSSCTGCGKYSDPSFTEMTTTETVIVGVAPVKMHFEGSEMNYGAETSPATPEMVGSEIYERTQI